MYLSIIAQHHPDRVPGLFGYQHRILNAHQQFRTESMLNDTASRSFYIAEEPHARWNQVNTTLWSTKCFSVSACCAHSAQTRTVRTTAQCTALPQALCPFMQASCPQQGKTKPAKFASTSTARAPMLSIPQSTTPLLSQLRRARSRSTPMQTEGATKPLHPHIDTRNTFRLCPVRPKDHSPCSLLVPAILL